VLSAAPKRCAAQNQILLTEDPRALRALNPDHEKTRTKRVKYLESVSCDRHGCQNALQKIGAKNLANVLLEGLSCRHLGKPAFNERDPKILDSWDLSHCYSNVKDRRRSYI